MFAYSKCRAMTAGFVLGLMSCSALAGGTQSCSVPLIPLFTTFDVWLDEPGDPTACVRDAFPLDSNFRQGWTTEEGSFGQSDPSDPSSWNSLDGLAIAVEVCYQVATYPFFPGGTCGVFEYPRYEGDYSTFNREWVMKWDLICGSPEFGQYEFRVPVYMEEFCPDGETPILDDGFE